MTLEKSFYKEYTNTELENSLNNIEDNLFKQLFIDCNEYYKPLNSYDFISLKYKDPIQLIQELVLPIKDNIINKIISSLDININNYDDRLNKDIINHFINSGDRFNDNHLISSMIANYLKYKANTMVSDLNDDNTNIGDMVDIDCINIDVFNRDGLFVYINGIIKYTMDKGKTHADLINEIIHNKKFNFYRPKYEDITDLYDSNTPLAFGHIVKNIGFIIETYNCDEYNIAEQVIKDIPQVEKVFSEPDSSNSLIRLANLENILENKQLVDNILKNTIDKFYDLDTLKILAKDNDITDIQYVAMDDFNYILENYADSRILQYLSEKLGTEINYDNLDTLLNYIKENNDIRKYWIDHVNDLAKLHTQNTLQQLLDKDDKIGDTIDNDQMSFDIVTKDKAILYLNDNVYTDNKHVNIINKLYNENFKLEYPDLTEYNAKSYAIGSLMNDDIAIFYDDTFHGCNSTEVANKAKGELALKKVYLFNIDNNTLTRCAAKSYQDNGDNIATAEIKVFNQLFINQKLGYEYLNNEKFNTVYKMTEEQTLKFLSSKYEDEIIDAMFEELNINPDDYDENLDMDIIDHFSTSQAILNTNLLDEYFALWTDKKAHDDIQVLSDSDVAVGRTLNLGRNVSHIDVFNRDGVFIYLDGHIEYSTEGLSHGQLLNKIMEDDIFDFKRPSIDQVQYNMGYDTNTPVAFGHIVGDIALIDTHENVDLLTVGKAALEIPGIKRAFTNPYHGITTRLAKKIL